MWSENESEQEFKVLFVFVVFTVLLLLGSFDYRTERDGRAREWGCLLRNKVRNIWGDLQ